MNTTHNPRLLSILLASLLAVSAFFGCSAAGPAETTAEPVPSETPAPTEEPIPFAEEIAAYETASEQYYLNQDYSAAFETLSPYADTEYAPVRELLGTMLYSGLGTKADRPSAVGHLTAAAEGGSALAAYMLGEIYRGDSITGIDPEMSAGWYEKALPLLETSFKDAPSAPEAGRTARAIALIYASGLGTQADTKKAEAAAHAYTDRSDSAPLWSYKIAADMVQLRYADAEPLLASLFDSIKTSAQNGSTEAMRFLANYFYFGEGNTAQDYTQVIQWLNTAAEQGDAIAQNDLAAMYRDGIGTEKNPDEAARLYQASANQGYALAAYNLATMYIDGTDLPQNLTKAAELLRSAAEQGMIAAQNRLGLLYFEEPMVEQNYALAAEWFQKAASAGNVYAEYNLGRCYLEGLGVEKSPDLAYEWLSKARDQKHSGADDLIRTNKLGE